jgi:Tol biopolymer transport system component
VSWQAAGSTTNIASVPVRRRWVLALVSLVVLAAVPATAEATLVFSRNPLNPSVFSAADDGSGARKLAPGSNPRISPNGAIVAFLHQGKGRSSQPELMLVPANGSAPVSRLATGWRETSAFAWSPDSASIAAVLGPELGPKRLVLIDVGTGAQQMIARGFFSAVSFAPEGGQLVYGRAANEAFPPRTDVYRYDIPIGQPLRAAEPVRLTRDHRSLSPLWGPAEKIVFVKQLVAKQRRYGPKNELYLTNPAGKQVRRLTHTKVGPLLLGLSPTDWSSNGKRLLAQFGGQDTSYAVTVNPRTGAQRPLVEATEQGFVGTALSAGGKLVLGATGGFEPGPGHDVATVPYSGGKRRMLAKNAFEPDWSR